MTTNYYIKTYQLSKQDAEVFLYMIEDKNQPIADDLIANLARRWIREIRPRCSDEVECRAVMFRTLMEKSDVENRPPGTTPMLAVAWAHMITDSIHQAVEAYPSEVSKRCLKNCQASIPRQSSRPRSK